MFKIWFSNCADLLFSAGGLKLLYLSYLVCQKNTILLYHILELIAIWYQYKIWAKVRQLQSMTKSSTSVSFTYNEHNLRIVKI